MSKLLVDKGADINALQATSSRGHGQRLRLLVDKGAGFDVLVGSYGNILQAASSRATSR